MRTDWLLHGNSLMKSHEMEALHEPGVFIEMFIEPVLLHPLYLFFSSPFLSLTRSLALSLLLPLALPRSHLITSFPPLNSLSQPSLPLSLPLSLSHSFSPSLPLSLPLSLLLSLSHSFSPSLTSSLPLSLPLSPISHCHSPLPSVSLLLRSSCSSNWSFL